MEETMTKVILIAFSLAVIAILLVTYTRIYGSYQETQNLISLINGNEEKRTLEVLYCFLNETSGNVEIHVFNYGDDVEYTLAAYYLNTDGDLTKVFEYDVNFPSEEMTVIEYTPPETPPDEFELVLVWVEAGKIGSVRCVGS